mgnify:FL=1
MNKVCKRGDGHVRVGDTVQRRPVSFSDSDAKNARLLWGTVVYVHPAASVWSSLRMASGRVSWGCRNDKGKEEIYQGAHGEWGSPKSSVHFSRKKAAV